MASPPTIYRQLGTADLIAALGSIPITAADISTSTTINPAGHLTIGLPDGSTVDCGLVSPAAVTLPPGALLGNPGTVSGTAGTVVLGAGLLMSGGTLSATGGAALAADGTTIVNTGGTLSVGTVPAADVSGLAAVATTGAYSDLTGAPTIPAAYTLSPAGTATLGGVLASTGTAGQYVFGINPATGALVFGSPAGAYTLPAATTSTLGGVVVSTGLAVSSGTLAVSYGTTAGTAAAGNDSRITGALQSSAIPASGGLLATSGTAGLANTLTVSGDGTLNTGTGALTVNAIGGHSVSLAGALTLSGAYSTTLAVSGATSITLPTSGTLATVAQLGGTASAVNAVQVGATAAFGTITFAGAVALAGSTITVGPGAPLFGIGVDGNVTLSTAITLTRHMHYTNLTIVSGGTINTNFWDIYVAGTLDLSAAGAGAIQCNGLAGQNAITGTGTVGGNNPGYNAPLSVSVVATGGTGGHGGNVNGQGAGSAFQPVSNAVWYGGKGGKGGNAAGTGGNGGTTPTAGTVPYGIMFPQADTTTYINAITTITQMPSGLPGGGGAPGDGSSALAGWGGNGASGGGQVRIAAAVIVTGTATPGGVVQACGGNGGAGAQPTNIIYSAGGGGGAGGGGYAHIAVGSLLGPPVLNAVWASGGAGGAGANTVNSTGSARGGDGGDGGDGGVIDVYLGVGTGSVSLTRATGAAGSAGGAGTLGHPGIGGSGGAGGACTASLPASFLTIGTPATTYSDATSLMLTGTYAGTTPTGINAGVDAGALSALSGPAIGAGVWSGTIGVPGVGTHTVTVQMANAMSLTATSGTFAVVAPTLGLGALAQVGTSEPYAVSGSWAGAAAPGGVQVTTNGTAWTALTAFGTSGTIWAGNAIAPSATGSYTLQARETANTSVVSPAGTLVVAAAASTLAITSCAGNGGFSTGTINIGFTGGQPTAMQLSFNNGGSFNATGVSMVQNSATVTSGSGATASGTAVWTFSQPGSIPDGTYTIKLRGIGGNTAISSAATLSSYSESG